MSDAVNQENKLSIGSTQDAFQMDKRKKSAAQTFSPPKTRYLETP